MRDPGIWSIAIANGKGGHEIKKAATADDIEDANGTDILPFYRAQDKARLIGRSGRKGDNGKPQTVAEAVDSHEADL